MRHARNLDHPTSISFRAMKSGIQSQHLQEQFNKGNVEDSSEVGLEEARSSGGSIHNRDPHPASTTEPSPKTTVQEEAGDRIKNSKKKDSRKTAVKNNLIGPWEEDSTALIIARGTSRITLQIGHRIEVYSYMFLMVVEMIFHSLADGVENVRNAHEARVLAFTNSELCVDITRNDMQMPTTDS